MTPLELATQILNQKKVHSASGVEYDLYAAIKWEEAEFITKLVNEVKPKKSIEIGLAFGVSALIICAELQNLDEKEHLILDPFQSTDWKNVGKTNLQKCGVDFFRLLEEKSEFALPRIVESGQKFDFALIDGSHTLDHCLIDFFYINRLLNVGGVIVFDDVNMPGLNKLSRYLLNYPGYEFAGGVPINPGERFYIRALRKCSRVIPSAIRHNIFSDKILKSDKELGLNSSMIAIRKTAEDNRAWDWYVDF